MRKYCRSILFITILMMGCDREEVYPGREQLEANKQTVRYLFETIWNDADFSAMETVVAPEVRFHFRGTAVLRPKHLRAGVTRWKEAFPDLSFVVEDLIAEKDLVAIRLRLTGTHTGTPWQGLQANGKPIDVSEMMFFRLQDGKIIEAWEVYDEHIMLKQLDQPVAGGDAAR